MAYKDWTGTARRIMSGLTTRRQEGGRAGFSSPTWGTAGVGRWSGIPAASGVREVDHRPPAGDNVVLTIDIDLQKQVEDILSQAIPPAGQ